MSDDADADTTTWKELSKNTIVDAKQQLKVIEALVRERLYAEYTSQCSDIAPYLHQRGRRSLYFINALYIFSLTLLLRGV